MSNLFSIGSPLAEVVMWVYGTISVILVFSPFLYLGYKKWRKHLPISWRDVFMTYLYSFLIYLTWNWILLSIVDSLLQKYYTNSWWLTNALVEGGSGPLFGVLIGWPLAAAYIIMAIKPGRYIILNLLLSIIVSGLLLWGAWYVFIIIIQIGFGLVANNL